MSWMMPVVGALLALLAALWATTPLWTRRGAAPPRAAHDLEVYKRQLAEVERDLTRGLLDETEAEGARREISRRILATADALEAEAPAPPAPAGRAQTWAAALIFGAMVGGGALYVVYGAPWAPDRPLAARNFQLELEARYQAARIEAGWTPRAFPPAMEGFPSYDQVDLAVKNNAGQTPDGPDERRMLAQAHMILAPAYVETGRYAEAWRLYARAIELFGPSADPGLFLGQGEAMVFAAGGVVSPQALEVLANAPATPRGRYYVGLAAEQDGRVREALVMWLEARAMAEPGPIRQLLTREVTRVANERGLDAARLLGEAVPERGPSAADVAAAEAMSPDARQDMIDGMVASLAARLQDDPSDINGWLQLIRAYGVLGRLEEAAAAVASARAQFASDDAALSAIREAALVAGLDG